jgi:hypothetical protein
VENASPQSTFVWSVEGGEIWSGQGSKSVEIEWRSAVSGRVKVIETNENGCSGDTVYLQTAFEIPAGLGSHTSPVSIYPNPVGDVLYIMGLNPGNGSIEFYSLLGQMVFRAELSNPVNLEKLDRGVYYLRILDGGGQPVLTRKIIKK